jgi:hypothetical protein
MHARARENSHTIFFEQAGAPFPKSLKSENDGEGGEGRGGGGGDVSSPTSITDNTESGKADSGFANGAGGVRTMGRKWGGEPHGVEAKRCDVVVLMHRAIVPREMTTNALGSEEVDQQCCHHHRQLHRQLHQ